MGSSFEVFLVRANRLPNVDRLASIEKHLGSDEHQTDLWNTFINSTADCCHGQELRLFLQDSITMQPSLWLRRNNIFKQQRTPSPVKPKKENETTIQVNSSTIRNSMIKTSQGA